jgi:hypothetical protein
LEGLGAPERVTGNRLLPEPETVYRVAGGGSHRSRAQVARKHAVIMQARQKKFRLPLREVGMKTAPPFSRSPGPITLNQKAFLRSVGEIAGPVINFHRYFSNTFFAELLRGRDQLLRPDWTLEALLRQCRFAFPFNRSAPGIGLRCAVLGLSSWHL